MALMAFFDAISFAWPFVGPAPLPASVPRTTVTSSHIKDQLAMWTLSKNLDFILLDHIRSNLGISADGQRLNMASSVTSLLLRDGKLHSINLKTDTDSKQEPYILGIHVLSLMLGLANRPTFP